jgi:hypothetical protein
LTFLYILCGATCFLSLVNLVAVIFLSNSLFRLLVAGRPVHASSKGSDAGLVDPSPTVTYDPRFRS